MSVTEEEHLSSELDSTEPAPGVPAGASVLEYLQARREQIAGEDREPLILAVPEWQGALAVKFAYPEQGATPIIRAGFRLQGQDPAKAVDAALDIILGAAVEVLGKRPDDEEWQPLDPTGRPTRINEGLAGMLGIDLPKDLKRKSRFIARNLWSPKAADTGQYEGDIALVQQAGQVAEWLRGEQAEIDEELAGE